MGNPPIERRSLGFVIVTNTRPLDAITPFIACYTTEAVDFTEICRKLFRFSLNDEGQTFYHTDILAAYSMIPKDLYIAAIDAWVLEVRQQLPNCKYIDLTYGRWVPGHIEFVVDEFVPKDPNTSQWM